MSKIAYIPPRELATARLVLTYAMRYEESNPDVGMGPSRDVLADDLFADAYTKDEIMVILGYAENGEGAD